MSQPDFFGDALAAAERDADAIPPAARSAALCNLARALPRSVRLGTSSWSFSGWHGLVYGGPQRDTTSLARHGLTAYAQHPLLRTVGVDRGYYAPVPEPALERYAAQVPDGFRFLVKAHAALTTPRSVERPPYLGGVPDLFLDATHARDHVIAPAQRTLGDKLGVLLLQFPPLPPPIWDWRAELLERLHDFLRALPRETAYALEWRNAEILGADYHSMLRAAGAVHAPCSHPRMPAVDEQGIDAGATPLLVIRWLLRRDRGYDEARALYAPFDRLAEPDATVRERIATLVESAKLAGREAFVIVNNKAEGSAPLSIEALAERIATPERGGSEPAARARLR